MITGKKTEEVIMRQPLTITELDQTAEEWIEHEAQRTGLPIETIARQLIYRGLEITRRQNRQERYHDLDSLAGTWSSDEVAQFRNAIADLNQVDQTLWQ